MIDEHFLTIVFLIPILLVLGFLAVKHFNKEFIMSKIEWILCVVSFVILLAVIWKLYA